MGFDIYKLYPSQFINFIQQELPIHNNVFQRHTQAHSDYKITFYGYKGHTRVEFAPDYDTARMVAERVGGTYECEDGPYAERIEIQDTTRKLVDFYPYKRDGQPGWQGLIGTLVNGKIIY